MRLENTILTWAADLQAVAAQLAPHCPCIVQITSNVEFCPHHACVVNGRLSCSCSTLCRLKLPFQPNLLSCLLGALCWPCRALDVTSSPI